MPVEQRNAFEVCLCLKVRKEGLPGRVLGYGRLALAQPAQRKTTWISGLVLHEFSLYAHVIAFKQFADA